MTRMFFRVPRASRNWGWAALLITLSSAGCQQEAQKPAKLADIASTVHAGDPQVAGQLLKGFYAIEQNSWRWTAQDFSVNLHPPAGAAQAGANLVVSLAVPDAVIQNLNTVSLMAALGETHLAPEVYTKAGSYTYKREVAANLLAGDMVRVDFMLDKSIPPSGQDRRQLGIVVTSIGLEPK